MKLSVSVPDDLFDMAAAKARTLSPSKVVQAALVDYLGPEDRIAYHQREIARLRLEAEGEGS